MRKSRPQNLRVVYEFIPSGPDDEKMAVERLERAFDVLFEAALEAESGLCESAERAKQNKIALPPQPSVDSFA
jgi:hypothetical protein